MEASEEFVIGKHSIGYVSNFFKNNFHDITFDARPMPTFQKLLRSMSDAEIESELKTGICGLGDVLAFLDGSPQECKDGSWNLFYFPTCVVFVRWDDDVWRVSGWHRDGSDWGVDRRVFSPATESSVPCGHCSLERKIFELEEWKKKVEKVLNI